MAKEIDADLVIIDEQMGRKYAKHFDLKLTGTLGILLKAKQKNLINSVQILISELQNEGIWLSEELIKLTLQKAEEL